MINQFGNKPEQFNGNLIKKDAQWFVESGYGTFPLKASLQSKPAQDSEGASVTVTVQHQMVIDYNFISLDQ